MTFFSSPRGFRALFSVALLCLFAAPPAQATSFYERPFPETVDQAPVIVRGRVGTKHADWAVGEDGTKRIYTFHDLAVDEVIKGNVTDRSIQMREMGGEKDGIGMQVAGSADFNTGEDVVMMLGNRNSDGSYDVWGLMMGKMNVEKGTDGQEYLVGPATMASATGGRILHDAGDTEGQNDSHQAKRWSLSDLRRLAHTSVTQSVSPRPVTRPESNRSPLPVAAASPVEQAPRLQPSPAEIASPNSKDDGEDEERAGFPLKTGLALGVIGALVLIWIWRVLGKR